MVEKYKPKEGLSLEEQIKESYNHYLNEKDKLLEYFNSIQNLPNSKNIHFGYYLVVNFDSQEGKYGYNLVAAMDLFDLSKTLIDFSKENNCFVVEKIYKLEKGIELEEADTGLADSLDGLISFLQRGCLDYPINNKGE